DGRATLGGGGADRAVVDGPGGRELADKRSRLAVSGGSAQGEAAEAAGGSGRTPGREPRAPEGRADVPGVARPGPAQRPRRPAPLRPQLPGPGNLPLGSPAGARPTSLPAGRRTKSGGSLPANVLVRRL